MSPTNKPKNDPSMGVSDYERIAEDFYATPMWMTEKLLDTLEAAGGNSLRKGDLWWEPACGEGHISEVMIARGYGPGYSSDLIDRGYGVGDSDFLAAQIAPVGTRLIITNPPYGELAEEFCVKALELMRPFNGSVVMLMRNEYDCAKGRRFLFQDHPAFACKVVSMTRPRWIAGSTGSPRHNYAWYVWDWRSAGRRPAIMYYEKD